MCSGSFKYLPANGCYTAYNNEQFIVAKAIINFALRPLWQFYFFIYITSFTSLTVRGISGRYNATRLGA